MLWGKLQDERSTWGELWFFWLPFQGSEKVKLLGETRGELWDKRHRCVGNDTANELEVDIGSKF